MDGRQLDQVIVSGRQAPSGNPFGQMYAAGIVHILTGIDHIAFIFLVLLGSAVSVGGRMGIVRIVKTLSLFTVAHSVSLGLAACGIWAPSARIVEPLIAASIVWQAISVMWSRGKGGIRHQSSIVFAFGLVHGFGFAGGIAEIGFNKAFIVPSLLGFNLGIETGQFAVAGVVVPLMLWAARIRPMLRLRVLQAASASLGVMGLVLLIQRVAGWS